MISLKFANESFKSCNTNGTFLIAAVLLIYSFPLVTSYINIYNVIISMNTSVYDFSNIIPHLKPWGHEFSLYPFLILGLTANSFNLGFKSMAPSMTSGSVKPILNYLVKKNYIFFLTLRLDFLALCKL